jgi:hypothetical protein
MSKNIRQKDDGKTVRDELHDLLGQMQAQMGDAALLTESFQALHARYHDSFAELPGNQRAKIIKIAVHAIQTHPAEPTC